MSHQTWLEAPYQTGSELAYEEYLEDQGVEDETQAEMTFDAWLEWKREL